MGHMKTKPTEEFKDKDHIKGQRLSPSSDNDKAKIAEQGGRASTSTTSQVKLANNLPFCHRYLKEQWMLDIWRKI
ncbi:unnamed protein product [Arabis nemorensis]|uniref:Uncharacterized protein n=1 Tax=Arabis nemorensis TaxID=586526 RepID=A0A565BPV0_9BRAS|nr:unnamed protein product [Arabis nemorensis]